MIAAESEVYKKFLHKNSFCKTLIYEYNATFNKLI